MNKRLAIIPARGGSKRIPEKNIYNFYGKPIISYSLETASKSKLFDTIHVSSDSKKILNTVANLGYKTDFKRPKSLSHDRVGLLKVLQYELKQFTKINKFFDVITMIFPTAPLIQSKDLIQASKLFEKFKRNYPVLSVSKFPQSLERAFKYYGEFMCPVDKKKLKFRSQDLPKRFFDTGDFSFHSAKAIEKYKDDSKYYKKFLPYEISKLKAVDIDDFQDIALAKLLFKSKI